MYTDFVINGQAHGDVAIALADNMRYDAGMQRPYLAEDRTGRTRRFVDIQTGRKVRNTKGNYVPEVKRVSVEQLQARGINNPTWNATSMRKEDWIQIDTMVVRSARKRLRAWTDLESASAYGGFDGMTKMTHEYEAMSDPGEALVDMDGLDQGRSDSPLFKLRSVPLPLTYSSFWYSERRLAISRNSNTPLDTVSAEAAGRRIGEMVEQTLIGTQTGVTYGTQSTGITAHDGTSTVYGYTNFPSRVTKTNLVTPTGSNPSSVLDDIITMRETMYTNKFYGPFVVYTSTPYDRYLDEDYFVLSSSGAVAPTKTLRQRINEIDGIADVRRLDFLTSGYQIIMVMMDPSVIQAINAMEITTVQWEVQGGMKKCFKVMCIKVPLLKAPYDGIAALIHGTTS